MSSESSSESDEPPKLSVQDVVFRAGGPFPPARLHYRFFAFALDAVLMGAISFFILTRFILPQWFPLELEIFQEWTREFLEAQEAAAQPNPMAVPPFDELPREVWNMLLMAQNCVVFLFWLYFAASDTFFRGQTLGKKTFRLSVVHMLSLGPPDLPTAFIRSILKTICLFTLFPVALISFFLVFFLKFKRAGHDLVSKTIVIEDNSVVVEKKST